MKSLLPRLGVNVDHVATVRQARRSTYPDPVHAAVLAELGGAAQITIHLREDRRHIQDRDLELMRRTVSTKLNLEMAASAEMLDIALRTKPDTVTLVPERRQEVTTEGGLDVAKQLDVLRPLVRSLVDAGMHVSMFIDPDVAQVDASAAVGAHAVELHTGSFCEAVATREAERQRLVAAAAQAVQRGLRCYAGHGLNYDNVAEVASILDIEELNIGHSIVGRALFVGMKEAVQSMRELGMRAREHAIAERAAPSR